MADIDPRFLGGHPAVITDTSQMALALTIDWNGAADISCQIDKPTAAKYLRMVADTLDPPVVCSTCNGKGYDVSFVARGGDAYAPRCPDCRPRVHPQEDES